MWLVVGRGEREGDREGEGTGESLSASKNYLNRDYSSVEGARGEVSEAKLGLDGSAMRPCRDPLLSQLQCLQL